MKMKGAAASAHQPTISLNSYLSSQKKQKAGKRDVQSVGMPLKRQPFPQTSSEKSTATLPRNFQPHNHHDRQKQQQQQQQHNKQPLLAVADDGTSVQTATTEASSSAYSTSGSGSVLLDKKVSCTRRRKVRRGSSSDSSVASVPITRIDLDKQHKQRSKHHEIGILEDFLEKGSVVREDAIVEKVWFDSVYERFQKAQQLLQQQQQQDDETIDGILSEGNGNESFSAHSFEPWERPISRRQTPAKQVRFDLDARSSTHVIERHEHTYLEEEDIEEYWYSQDQITIMRENTAIVSRVTLLQNTATLQAVSKAYQWHATNSQQQQALQRTGANKNVEEDEEDETPTPESIRESLVEIYRTNSLMVGLEHICLTSVRGDAGKLMLFGLEHARAKQPKDPDERAHLWAHVTHCISAPSALVARDMGQALATALQQQKEEDKGQS